MNLEWWHLIVGFIGTNGITYYLARPKKNSLEIENFKRLFDEAQEERENMKMLYNAYEEKTDRRIKELEDKLTKVETKNNALIRAVNTAYRCPLAENIHECPVLQTFDEQCGTESK